MGLTRIRAEQISDIDYKQSVRVIALENTTLTGGAPAVVDGASLVAGDRVLVAAQDNAAQNGLYQVQTVGAGSNGTWVRTSDANEDGEIQPGMVVMVTQGTEYADTPWKLVTNGVIEIGVTELVFEENYSLAFGNVFANGTAVIATAVSDGIVFAAGENVSITGNNTTKTVTISATGGGGGGGSAIINGASNVDIATANADITMGVNGTANVVVVSSDGITVAGNVLPSANVSFDLGTDSQRWRDIYLANSTIYLGNAQISANATSLILTNPAGAQTVFSGATPSVNANTVVATGNITGGNLGTAGQVSATGNITGGNLSGTSIVGTLTTAAQTNITSVGTLGSLTVTGNVTGGNLTTAGQVVATGNITGGNLIGLVSLNTRERTLNFIIDGGGDVITTGSKGYAVIDADCTITSWNILLDQTGNANVDVKRSTFAGFPTTASIAGTIPPTVTSNTKAQNTTLTGWGNTTIINGDILEFVVQGIPATATRVTVALNLVSSS